jgi:ribonuclease BN (tRNA processing enzyme)
MATFKIHGVRGGMAVSGSQFLRYGGHTTCFSVETDAGLLIIDAGTGLSHVDQEMEKRTVLPPMTILFTHFHLDHIIGLPLFRPLYRQSAQIRLMADPRREDVWTETIQRFCRPPYWPKELKSAGAALSFEQLPVDRGFAEIHGTRVTWCPVWHPQQCLAYKIQVPQATIVIATDHETGNGPLDDSFMEFCKGADILVYDAQYTPEEYPRFRGWGHSTWREAARIAADAGVRELILTHLSRSRTDAAQDEIIAHARAIFPATRGAVENMTVIQ